MLKRKRHQRFVETFLDELGTGKDVQAAAHEAGRRQGWTTRRGKLSERAIRVKSEALLVRADITDAIREFFGVAAEFYPHDGAQMLVRHIKGEIPVTRKIVTKDGVDEVTEMLPPSLEALKHYHNLTLRKPAKQVQVDQRVLVAKALVTDEPPAIKARSLEPKAIESKADA